MTTYRFVVGDCRQTLTQLPDASVQTCVTSPPYFGLRDYGHDGQIGLESTPEAFVSQLVDVFREVRRVLRDDGTVWLNLGDSYAAQRGGSAMPAETLAGGISGRGDTVAKRGRESEFLPHRNAASLGLKHKDLIGIPWRVAFALQSDGWYLRQDIIWHKPNPMPESVRDRCTKAHEYLFLLAKSERYYYDADAIAENANPANFRVNAINRSVAPGQKAQGKMDLRRGEIACETRNRRSVWTVPLQPYSGAHFATFPPALIEPCILAGSRVGDTVLDPFNGAGTTGMVSVGHGRHYIGCELNPDYVALSRTRIASVASLFAKEI